MASEQASNGTNPPWFNQVLALRVTVIGSAIAMVASVVFLLCFLPEVLVRSHTGNSDVERALIAELSDLRSAWDPGQRERLLAGAVLQRERYAGTLNRLLRIHRFDLLKEAVDYAGAMGDPEMRPALVSLVDTKARLARKVRPKAIVAAERLAPWTQDRLVVFLTDGTTAVKLAALEVVSQRQDGPWSEVIELLSSSDEVLRAGAIAAIPSNPPPGLMAELWHIVSRGDPEVDRVGLRALAQVECTPEVQARLVALLPQLDESARLMCLEMIGKSGLGVQDPSRIWALVIDQNNSEGLRTRAIFCLEQTRSYDVGQLLDRFPFMAPMCKYFVCRCLLASGYKDGSTLLLDLAEAEEEDVQLASRRLLAWLTGRGPGTDRDDFVEVLEAGRGSRGPLPSPSYEFAVRE